MKLCAICRKEVDAENAPILSMGSYGNPKYLCDECASDIDLAVTSKNGDEIEAAMQKVSSKLADTGAEDTVVVNALKDIFTAAGERAKKINAMSK